MDARAPLPLLGFSQLFFPLFPPFLHFFLFSLCPRFLAQGVCGKVGGEVWSGIGLVLTVWSLASSPLSPFLLPSFPGHKLPLFFFLPGVLPFFGRRYLPVAWKAKKVRGCSADHGRYFLLPPPFFLPPSFFPSPGPLPGLRTVIEEDEEGKVPAYPFMSLFLLFSVYFPFLPPLVPPLRRGREFTE